jgi:hypothetical protein
MVLSFWSKRRTLEHLQQCSVSGPAKLFFTSKFSYVLFCNPTNKTKTGTANSKPPGPIIMMGRSETLSSSYIIFITLFLQVHSVAAPFTSHGNVCNYAEPKPFS